MYLIYVDDSKDGKNVCFSAIMIPAEKWLQAFEHLVSMRRTMREHAGVYMTLELHATDWVGGRGNVAPKAIPRHERVQIFNYVLDQIVKLPDVAIFNAHGPKAEEETLFSRMIQRFENTVKRRDSRAIVISDEGKNYDFLLRKMRRFNYIPSALGAWENGETSKNIPAERIIEDLVYRDSKRSYFIQAADFCAYALLRYETPTERAQKMGFHESFLRLEPALFKAAFKADPRKLGIIRA